MTHLTAQQLRLAARIRERIDKLERMFAALLQASDAAPVVGRKPGRRAKKAGASVLPAPRPRRRVTKAARAKLALAMKKRWAKAKAAGKKSL